MFSWLNFTDKIIRVPAIQIIEYFEWKKIPMKNILPYLPYIKRRRDNLFSRQILLKIKWKSQLLHKPLSFFCSLKFSTSFRIGKVHMVKYWLYWINVVIHYAYPGQDHIKRNPFTFTIFLCGRNGQILSDNRMAKGSLWICIVLEKSFQKSVKQRGIEW